MGNTKIYLEVGQEEDDNLTLNIEAGSYEEIRAGIMFLVKWLADANGKSIQDELYKMIRVADSVLPEEPTEEEEIQDLLSKLGNWPN